MDTNCHPKDWRRMLFGDAARFTRKPTGLRYEAFDAVPFVPMELIPQAGPCFSAYLVKEPHALTSGVYFEDGDILLPRITPSFENGKQGIIEGLPLRFGVATTEAIPLREVPGVSDRLFLFYWLLRGAVRSDLAGKMEGTTGRQRLGKSVLANTEIDLPPLPEQRAVAKALLAVQEAREARRRELELERERKAALMECFFTYGTRGEPTKQTEIGEIPEGWAIRRLGNLGCVKGGKRLPKGAPYSEEPTAFPYIRVVDLRDGSVALDDLRYLTPDVQQQISRYTIGKTDVYISIAGTIGLVGTIPDVLDGANLTENAAKISVLDPQRLHYMYLAAYLSSERGQHAIASLTAKTSQPKLALVRIEMIPIPLPALDEQLEIAAALAACDARRVAIAKETALLDELFHATLDELMTGRLSAVPLIDAEETP